MNDIQRKSKLAHVLREIAFRSESGLFTAEEVLEFARREFAALKLITPDAQDAPG